MICSARLEEISVLVDNVGLGFTFGVSGKKYLVKQKKMDWFMREILLTPTEPTVGD